MARVGEFCKIEAFVAMQTFSENFVAMQYICTQCKNALISCFISSGISRSEKTQIFRFFGPDLCPESAKPFWNLFALQKKCLQIHWRKFQVDKFTEKSKTRFEERNKMARICAQNLFPKGYSLICSIDFIKKIQRSSLHWSKFRFSYKNSCLGPKYRLIWPGFVPRTRFE